MTSPYSDVTDEFLEVIALVRRIDTREIDSSVGCVQLLRRLTKLHGDVVDALVNAHLAGQDQVMAALKEPHGN